MKNALLIVTILFAAIMSTACINNFAVQELNNKAQEYLAKGDYSAAIGRLEASIDIDPTIFETHYNLGIACINAEEYEKAVDALKKAAEIKPNDEDVYYSLAVAEYNYAEEVLEGEKDDNSEDKAKTEPVSVDDMQKAADLYSDAVVTLEKYLTFEVDDENKSAATSQLESIKSKLADLQPKLPKQEG